MRFHPSILCIGVLLLLVPAGCGDGDATPPVNEEALVVSPQTPGQALANLQTAVRRGEVTAVMDQLEVDESDEGRAAAMVRLVLASRQFRDLLIEKFGEQGWEQFNDREGAWLSLDTPLLAADPTSIEVEQDDEAATATATVDGRPIALVLRDGVWRVRVSSLLPPSPGDRRTVQEELYRALEASVTDGGLAIEGETGVTPQSLDRRMGRQFLAAIQEAQPVEVDDGEEASGEGSAPDTEVRVELPS